MNSSSSKPEIDDLLKIYEFSNSASFNFNNKVYGFLVESTAPINVGDKNHNEIEIPYHCRKKYFLEDEVGDTSKKIAEIVEILNNSEDPEIVVRIHGYSTSEEDVIKSYSGMIDDLNEIQKSNPNKTFIFLGYRWPSEAPNINNIIFKAIPTLPTLPRLFLLGSAILISISVGLLSFELVNKISLPLLILFSPIIVFALFGLSFSAILTLILLRYTAYFRDSFRATNYAVPDLVELIRNLDLEIDKSSKKYDENKLKLSFIAHSMGSYITTNTVRILSDVFTKESIKGEPTIRILSDTFTEESIERKLSHDIGNIGNVFALERLILVAPDIPVETIIPRRANFLQSSLRRFKETYIFSNEGDVILRILSTAANYFSFPGSDRFSGYRLGNITVSHCKAKFSYGVVNLDVLNKDVLNKKEEFNCLEWLEVRSSDKSDDEENRILKDFLKNSSSETSSKASITNKFTYFDCTDYKDCTKDAKHKVHPVGLALKKKALNFLDYVWIFIQHVIFHKIDTHGGYFEEKFSKELISKLAFLGFDGLIGVHSHKEQHPSNPLTHFDELCMKNQIKVVLSPDRYKEILDTNVKRDS